MGQVKTNCPAPATPQGKEKDPEAASCMSWSNTTHPKQLCPAVSNTQGPPRPRNHLWRGAGGTETPSAGVGHQSPMVSRLILGLPCAWQVPSGAGPACPSSPPAAAASSWPSSASVGFGSGELRRHFQRERHRRGAAVSFPLWCHGAVGWDLEEQLLNLPMKPSSSAEEP